MKSRSMMVWLGLLTAAVGYAQTAPSAAPSAPMTDAQKKAATTAPAASKAPAAKAPAAKAPAAKAGADTKKEEPPPPIEGITIERGKGNLLGLKVVNGNFVLTFYDAKHKKIPADMVRAALHWSVKYQPADERTVLNPGSTPSVLTSAKVVRPPLLFKVFISLFATEGSDAASENYTVDYHE